MLYANTGVSKRCEVPEGAHTPPELADAVWIDLVDPTDGERSMAEKATGLRVPARADLVEIETSSRLSTERGALYLSSPAHVLDADGVSQSTPLGFVLSGKVLMTVRYADLSVFAPFAERLAAQGARPGSVATFLGLLEAIVDRLADVLEHIGAELDAISRRVFRPDVKGARASTTDMQLRATLRTIGRAGDRLSNLRDSLLGVQRIVQYTTETAAPWIPAEERPRLVTLLRDITSLAEYDTQLSNKVQFVLDATLGFISMEQNNSIKVLTVVSVVGVPPTLVASIYGMNFKGMPELQWEHGYLYGLSVIVASAILPLIWFRKRGWI